MSRCFPFPPPGYEKKIRTDAPDSLIKEKHKEKKQKKDKKDKEKKERKEKDKETSKDKHKDKERKEKKEKHKDRKAKDKDRDKEKSRPSEDKKAAGALPKTGDREKFITDTVQNNDNEESKFVQDLARRIRDEEATESQIARKINYPNGVTENNISHTVPQTNYRKDDDKRINTHSNFAMAKRSENAVLRVSACMDQKGAEVMVKPVEKKDVVKKMELQEKNHNNGIKKVEPKNITDRSSKEKKEQKSEVTNKTGQEKPKLVEGGPRVKEREHESVDMKNLRVPELSRESVKNRTIEGILSKRKDPETNGLLYENGFRPNKIRKPVASPISSLENGRKVVACQTPPKPSSELQGTVCNSELKVPRINGFTDSQEPRIRPPVSSVKVKENSEASAKKRSHPDLKYLDQILNVPKREELCAVDDDEQEWLLGQSGMKSLKKQRTDSTTSLDETQQVWNQALRIESADITALPYVVPF